MRRTLVAFVALIAARCSPPPLLSDEARQRARESRAPRSTAARKRIKTPIHHTTPRTLIHLFASTATDRTADTRVIAITSASRRQPPLSTHCLSFSSSSTRATSHTHTHERSTIMSAEDGGAVGARKIGVLMVGAGEYTAG